MLIADGVEQGAALLGRDTPTLFQRALELLPH